MDGFDEQQNGGPETSGGTPEEAPKLSAAFLPYDDERLWVGMPADQRGKKRTAKRRPPKRSRVAAEGSEPTRTSRLSRPISFGRRQIATAILTLALPVSAFAVTGVLSDDVQLPTAPGGTPTLSPVTVTVELVGLRADRISPKRVELLWEVPDLPGPLTYAIYRDGVVIAETNDPSFIDSDVEPQRYYYYAVAAVTSGGQAAASPQLLVAVPSETGELPEGPAPAAPGPIVIVTPPSPSPTRTPSPTKSKIVWPSTDFGGGGGTTTTTTTTTSTPPDPCIADPTGPGCPSDTATPPPPPPDPCLADPTGIGCPSDTSTPPPPTTDPPPAP